MDFQCDLEDRLGPIGRLRTGASRNNAPLAIVKYQFRRRLTSGSRIGFEAVVIETEFRHLRKQTDKVGTPLIEALTDLYFWNVVTALRQARANTLDMQFWRSEAYEPDPQFHARIGCRFQQRRNRRPAQSGFESKCLFL